MLDLRVRVRVQDPRSLEKGGSQAARTIILVQRQSTRHERLRERPSVRVSPPSCVSDSLVSYEKFRIAKEADCGASTGCFVRSHLRSECCRYINMLLSVRFYALLEICYCGSS